MKRTTMMAMGLAVLALGLGACIEDDSGPNRRGYERPALGAGVEGTENAGKRVLESPQRELPTGKQEFPGQSRGADAGPTVVMLEDVGPATSPATGQAGNQAGSGSAAASQAVSAAGSLEMREDRHYSIPGRAMIVPGTGGLVVAADWGTAPAMQEYPHRSWPDDKATYLQGDVKGNPVYMKSLLAPYDYYDPRHKEALASGGQDLRDLVDLPWFFGESLAMPFMMVKDEPWKQRSTAWMVSDPVYRGYLPPGGEIAPTAAPGVIKWTYPFTATQPATLPAEPSK